MNTNVNEASPTSVFGYVVIFSILYSLFMAGIQLLVNIYGIDPGASSNIVILMVSALVATAKFVYDNKRPPEKVEKRKLIWLSILSSMMISVLFAMLLLAVAGDENVVDNLFRVLASLNGLTWSGILLTVILINYVVFRVNYGLAARVCYRFFCRER